LILKKFLDDLLVIIVLYNHGFEESAAKKSLSAALHQVNLKLDLFLYDNSSTPVYNKEFFELDQFNIKYISDPSNPGVSKAYNTGAGYADTLGKKWVLLLDQDTEFGVNLLPSYYEKVAVHGREINLFAPKLVLKDGSIFSPSRYKYKRGFKISAIEPGIHSFKKISPVNSGMLINLKSFLGVDGYNEAVRLDFSDFQFIERFKKNNDNFILINLEGLQDFSDESGSLSSSLNRFKIYCECAKACHRNSIADDFFYFLNSMNRSLKLSFRFRTLAFFVGWFRTYLT
jgi:rhamnosyltransferase